MFRVSTEQPRQVGFRRHYQGREQQRRWLVHPLSLYASSVRDATFLTTTLSAAPYQSVYLKARPLKLRCLRMFPKCVTSLVFDNLATGHRNQVYPES